MVEVKVLVVQLGPTFCHHHGLKPARIRYPWDSTGKNTGVGCHSLLQGDLPNLSTEPGSPALQADLLPESPGKSLLNSYLY